MKRSVTILISAASGFVLLAAAATAGAAIAGPIDSGVIHGCYYRANNAGSHTLVLQDVGTTCPNNTTAIQWNQTGPAGQNGTNGTNGKDGTSVTSTALSAGDSNCANGGSSFTSASGTTYACNGAQGPPGPAGAAYAILQMTAAGAGSNASCSITTLQGTNMLTLGVGPGDCEIFSGITGNFIFTLTPVNQAPAAYGSPTPVAGDDLLDVNFSSTQPAGTTATYDVGIFYQQ